QQQASGATITLNRPTGTANGNYEVACIYWFVTSNTLTAPAAFSGTALSGFPVSSGNNRMTCYGKFANNEPATYVWSQTQTGSGMAVFVATYANVLNIDGLQNSNVLTSATANFTAAQVGYPICIATIGAGSTQLCGAVTGVTNATTITTNLLPASTSTQTV